jgi:hypothetical protein
MEIGFIIICVAAAFAAWKLIVRIWWRNKNPHNRKCTAEICQYLVSTPNAEPAVIFDIFMSNARYRSQAQHVATMVPRALVQAGHDSKGAWSLVPMLMAIASQVPK